MSKLINNFFKSSIIGSISLIIFGILMIVQSEATIMTISYIIGGLLIALGAISILKFFQKITKENRSDLDMVYGLVCVILGILIIENPYAIASVIPFILGLIIIINSATKLQYSFELKKEKNDLWISTMLLSIIMVICGTVLIFNPFKGAVLLTRLVGIFILIYAILDLISTLVIKSNFNKIHDAIEEGVKEADIVEERDNKKKSKGKEKNK